MLWFILAAVCAFFIKGLCGFANTLVFTGILSFHSNSISISPVELLLGYPTNLILAWKERRSIRWKVCLPMAALVTSGSVPGILLLKNASVSAFWTLTSFREDRILFLLSHTGRLTAYTLYGQNRIPRSGASKASEGIKRRQRRYSVMGKVHQRRTKGGI